jgi:hypothetical protein
LEEKSPPPKTPGVLKFSNGIGDFMHHSSKTLVSESADQNKRFSNNKNINAIN